MLDVNTLKPIFAEKLVKTGSFDAALLKIVWIAYKAGLAQGAEEGAAKNAITNNN